MAEHLGDATLRLGTDDKGLDSGLSGAEAKTRSKLGTLGTLALGAGVGIAAAFTGTMLKAGADVENAFAEVRTLLPTIGDEAFGALKQDVLDFGKETGTATTETIPALYQAISAGRASRKRC